MTAKEILETIRERHSVRTLSNTLSADSRFCRTDAEHYGLRTWGFEEYSSIVNELVSEIDRNRGEATFDHLMSTITSKFGVSPSSVKTYLYGPRFVRTSRGTFRARTDQESFIITKKIELTKHCYRLDRGWAYRITVDEDALRGSGRMLPVAFADEMALVPLRSRILTSMHGSIKVSWPTMQPTIGSLSRVLEQMGGVIGDYVFIEFIPKSEVQFLLVKKTDLDKETGLGRLRLETGTSRLATDGNGIACIAQALGLTIDASLQAIRHRLEARGEHDLVPLLPKAPANDENAIQELLDFVLSC